jgi:hypothetical protein
MQGVRGSNPRTSTKKAMGEQLRVATRVNPRARESPPRLRFVPTVEGRKRGCGGWKNISSLR